MCYAAARKRGRVSLCGVYYLFVVGIEETVFDPPDLSSGVTFGRALHFDKRVLQTLATQMGTAKADRQLQVLLELFQADALQHSLRKVQIEAITKTD